MELMIGLSLILDYLSLRKEQKVMILGTKEGDSFLLNIDRNKIGSSTEATLLGVKIDKQLEFKSHIEELFRKVAYELHALRSIGKYLTVKIPFSKIYEKEI